MIWWIVGGVVLLALIVLAIVALGTVRRLPALQRAMAGAQQQAAAGVDQERVQKLQQTLDGLKVRMARTQTHLAMIKSARSGDDPGR